MGRLKAMFPEGRFGPPAHRDLISATEGDLGIRLPEQLRALCLECDGFREPMGNSKYLLSLQEEDFIGSLIRTTRFWWNDWRQIVPEEIFIDFTPFVFFGSSCTDHVWGIRWKGGGEIIAYHHDMEGEYEIVGDDILEVYRRDYSTYENLGD